MEDILVYPLHEKSNTCLGVSMSQPEQLLVLRASDLNAYFFSMLIPTITSLFM